MKPIPVKLIADLIATCGHIMKDQVTHSTILIDPDCFFIHNYHATIKLEVETRVTATVNFDKFKSLISKLDKKQSFTMNKEGEFLHINVNGKTIMKMKSEKRAQEIKAFSEIYSNTHYVGKMLSSDIDSIIQASNFISYDDLRPAMKHVCVDDSMIAATDGHMLYYEQLKSNLTVPEIEQTFIHGSGHKAKVEKSNREYPVMIPDFILNILKKTVKDYQIFIGWNMEKFPVHPVGESRIEIKDMGIRFVADGFYITFKLCDERYPDYKTVIPNFLKMDQSEMIVEFKKSEVLGAIKICEISSKTSVVLDFKSQSEKVIFYSEDLDDDSSNEMEVIPNSIEVKMHQNKLINCDEIGFNPIFLKKIISLCNQETFSMKFFAPNRATIINGNFLLMPVMIRNYVD